jgi:hypothetical protein
MMIIMENCPETAEKTVADWEDFKANNEVNEQSVMGWAVPYLNKNCPAYDTDEMMKSEHSIEDMEAMFTEIVESNCPESSAKGTRDWERFASSDDVTSESA